MFHENGYLIIFFFLTSDKKFFSTKRKDEETTEMQLKNVIGGIICVLKIKHV